MIVVLVVPTWMDPIKAILRGEAMSKEADLKKMQRKAVGYGLSRRKLYKRGFSLQLLRCLDPEEVNYALREIHEGI